MTTRATISQVDKLTYLREVDVFQDLSAQEIAALGDHAPMTRVAAGATLYAPDRPVEVLFILKQGRVRLYHLLPDGRKVITTVLESGVIFGEMALIGQELDGAFAETLDDCVLCLMSRNDVKTLLLGDPRIAFRIAETLGRRLIETERRLMDIAFKRVPERVALLLLELARQSRDESLAGHRTTVRTTHEELADMSGTYRETVSKVLGEFRAHGLIELGRGKIILLDMEGLSRVAEAGL
ncbi:MAG: Crp/Fnr family transcriptional regulator [Chloroflexi bacterium]|nr:Crp/Fnr family transcriptional regulator [Chloroflexota bacterium]